jgi:cytochrome c biogenesis protein
MVRLFTSIPLVVVLITILAAAGLIAIVLPQYTSSALRSAADHAGQLAAIHVRLDPGLGAGLVNGLERLGLFGVFTSGWFAGLLATLVVSIVVCTLDRAPRLWRRARAGDTIQSDAFYAPDLPDRAVIAGHLEATDVRAALRRAGFRVCEAVGPDGAAHLQGVRHRYAGLATVLTHLGLIGFVVAALVTSQFGLQESLVLPVGRALPVDRIGSTDPVSVRNLAFVATRDAGGRFTDFTTELAVYRGGQEVARRTIRVNDPLEAAGCTFHQQSYGPAVSLTIHGPAGELLWQGPIALDDVAGGQPYRRFAVPGREEMVDLLLDHAEDGGPLLVLVGYVPAGGWNADGTLAYQAAFSGGLVAGRSWTASDGLRIAFDSLGSYAGVTVRRDPGAPIVWLSFAVLVAGLVTTFYLPRRRVWARVGPGGEVRLVARADRFVNLRREFAALLADLAIRRHPPTGSAGPTPGMVGNPSP